MVCQVVCYNFVYLDIDDFFGCCCFIKIINVYYSNIGDSIIVGSFDVDAKTYESIWPMIESFILFIDGAQDVDCNCRWKSPRGYECKEKSLSFSLLIN